MSEDFSDLQPDRLLKAFDFAGEIARLEDRHHNLILALLNVMDSLERCLDGATAEGSPVAADTSGMVNTVRLIARQLEKILSEAGVTPIDCLGKKVDPHLHEIVDVKETDAVEDETIVEVITSGYQRDGTPLRRPQVVVARRVKSD
jgi:molecular chaperone GrpE